MSDAGSMGTDGGQCFDLREQLDGQIVYTDVGTPLGAKMEMDAGVDAGAE
jgi:hypothetical protein